ncbi:MAG TPA: DUF6266 family protein [Methanocorpusculum sp.]|nr:DUF6266 family protein [Methanocorpusculum sp.]
MGTIKQGILGGFSGKVGTVIGSSWKDISYMRGRAQSVKNPRTEGQVEQRSKFALTLDFLKPITAYVRTGYKTYAAMSYIVKNAVSGAFPNYALDFSRVLVSRGSLTQPSTPNVSISAGRATVTWNDNRGQSDAQPTDVAMPLAFNTDKGEAVFSTATTTRADQSAELNFPADWNGDTVELYIGFASADGINVANSIYLGNHAVI